MGFKNIKEIPEFEVSVRMADKFNTLAVNAIEYPKELDGELKDAVNWALSNNILDKNYYLKFYIIDSKKVDGDPGTGPILFKDSYDWEDEEYKGDFNQTFFTDIAEAGMFFSCKSLYEKLPAEAKDFYDECLNNKTLTYATQGDKEFDKALDKWGKNNPEGIKVVKEKENEIKTLICYSFNFKK